MKKERDNLELITEEEINWDTRRINMYYIFYQIRMFFKNIKWALQRARKGYCDKDTHDIMAWFSMIMPKMLSEFDNNLQGYPDGILSEEWSQTLHEMIDLASKLEDGSFTGNEQDKDEFFKLFSKYFYNLWD